MRKQWIVGLMVAGLLVGTSAPVWASNASDTAIDRVGDWLATVGKSGTEKDAALAQRKAERAAKRAQQMARKQAKQAGREMSKAGKETNKALQSLTN